MHKDFLFFLFETMLTHNKYCFEHIWYKKHLLYISQDLKRKGIYKKKNSTHTWPTGQWQQSAIQQWWSVAAWQVIAWPVCRVTVSCKTQELNFKRGHLPLITKKGQKNSQKEKKKERKRREKEKAANPRLICNYINTIYDYGLFKYDFKPMTKGIRVLWSHTFLPKFYHSNQVELLPLD